MGLCLKNGGNSMIDFGYRIEKGKFTLDPINSKAVEMIHAVYIDTHSVYAVINHMDASEFMSPGGKKTWTRSTVRKILGNEIYRGNELLPRLLPDEIIDKVNEIFEEKNSKNISEAKQVKLKFANVYCSKCDSLMKPALKNHSLYECDCSSVEESFIQESFVALASAIFEDPQLVESYAFETVEHSEVKEMNTQVEQAINDSKYSHFNVISLLKQRASLAYKHSKLNEEEMKSMKILNAFLKEKTEEFDWILYSCTIQKVNVLESNLISLVLINGQEFEFENEGG